MAGGDQIRRVAERAAAFPRQFVEDGAETIGEAITDRLTNDTGGDMSLSRAPGEMSVEVDVSGNRSATALITPEGGERGQWRWLEEGTVPHQIGGGMHPGTTGKRTWTDPLDRPLRRLPRDAERAFERVMGG